MQSAYRSSASVGQGNPKELEQWAISSSSNIYTMVAELRRRSEELYDRLPDQDPDLLGFGDKDLHIRVPRQWT